MFFSKRVERVLFILVLLASLFFYAHGSNYTGGFIGIFDDFFQRGSPDYPEEGCVFDNGGEVGNLVYLNKPYEDSIVSGYTDIGDYESYEWRVDGEIIGSGDDGQLTLFHFDDSLDSSDGLSPTTIPEGTTYSPGKFSNGLDLTGANDRVEYENFDKLDPVEGTVEMWLIFQEAEYGGNPFFRYQNSDLRFSLDLDQDDEGLKIYLYDYNSGAGDAAELIDYDFDIGEAYHIVFTYSNVEEFAYVYVNGLKEAAGDYSFSQPGTSGTFGIGNENVIIDELRIYSRKLSNEEIEYIYLRDKPFFDNEIYFDGDIEAGEDLALAVGLESVSSVVYGGKFDLESSTNI